MAKITDPLVLPADVRLVPVTDLTESVREHLTWDEGDVAISRLRSRTPSKVISAETAALVEHFRSPKKIVEVIIRYSLTNKIDPNDTLQNAFPILQQLINTGLLVPADSADAEQVNLTLCAGDRVDGFTVICPIHILEDVELYEARAENGIVVALKIARPEVGSGVAHILSREAAILHLLDGTLSPKVVTTGEYQRRTYLAMTWCAGVSAEVAAAELRQDPAPHSRLALLNLCQSILDAYANLHAQGVIHGDVHPNNILIDGSGAVRLIDFGLARVPDPACGIKEIYRGGIAFFFEPEYAVTARAGKPLLPASQAGEQYCLAVLLYYLLTGLHYLDFSLEQDEMLRQISEDHPLPFVRQGLDAWPTVEQALERALCKNPMDRYKDVATFASALRAIADSFKSGLAAVDSPLQVSSAAKALQTEILARVALNGTVFVNGLPKPPTASINMGTAGIAHMLYRVSCARGEPALLALADIWATRAAANIGDDAGFYNPDVELTMETVGRISPYHTPTGVFAVQALIAQARGDRMAQAVAAHNFVAAGSQPSEGLDLALGKSGLLIAGALLCEALSDRDTVERSGVFALGNSTMASIWETLDGYPQIRDAGELTNLGIAHGWGGILYATLRWCDATNAVLPTHTEERLHQLAVLAEPTGRGVRWPWQLDRPGLYMPGWCNGSAGHVFLWTLSHRLFSKSVYFELAEKAAWNCWEDPAQIANLCCGLAGRAYALLHWYKYSENRSWLHKAVALANQAIVNIRSFQPEDEKGFENSLYKGEVGVVALLEDLEHPMGAAMPFFESENWMVSPLRALSISPHPSDIKAGGVSG